MQINKYKNLGSGWFSQSQRHSNAKKFGIAGGLYALDSKKQILKSMTIDEIKERLQNSKKYKQENLIPELKQQIENMKYERDIKGINYYKKLLNDVKKGKDVDEIFEEQFPDEPSDEEINQFRHNKKGLYAKSQIFYAKHMIDPRDSEYDEKIYSELHFSDSEKPVVMKRSYFDEKYGQLFTQEQVKKIPEDLEVIFSKYNSGSRNPIATPTGQESIKSRGIHHTSMSIGDVIRVVRSGNKPDDYFITANVGFRKLILE